MDRVVAKDAKSVSCRQHTQGSVLRRGVVKMNTQGEHLRKSARRGMSIDHALFNGPRSPTRRLLSTSQWERRVLMPDHEPIGVRRFFEHCCPERIGGCAQNAARDIE